MGFSSAFKRLMIIHFTCEFAGLAPAKILLIFFCPVNAILQLDKLPQPPVTPHNMIFIFFKLFIPLKNCCNEE